MKTITYKFNDGTTSAVEVSDEIFAELKQMKKDMYNNDHANTRRHFSLDRLIASHGDIEDSHKVDDDIMSHFFDDEKLQFAFDHLLPRQRELIFKIYFDGYSLTEIAEQDGVSCAAINHRLEKIYAKLQKFYERG